MRTLRRAGADFALTADAQGIFQRMMCLALVEADLCTALHADVEYPFDDEQRPLDTAHLAQRGGKIVLARIGGELAQDAARRDMSSAHGGGAAEQIGPVGNDQRITRLAAHQRAQFARSRGRVDNVQSLCWRVEGAWYNAVGEHRDTPEKKRE